MSRSGVRFEGPTLAGWWPRSVPETCSPKAATSARGLGLVPKQISTGDRTILGSISRLGNRYLRVLFVQAAWIVLVKLLPTQWERYGLKSWIEAAKKRLHHNVLAIALANKLARIAWAVLNRGRAFVGHSR
jgi:transposase